MSAALNGFCNRRAARACRRGCQRAAPRRASSWVGPRSRGATCCRCGGNAPDSEARPASTAASAWRRRDAGSWPSTWPAAGARGGCCRVGEGQWLAARHLQAGQAQGAPPQATSEAVAAGLEDGSGAPLPRLAPGLSAGIGEAGVADRPGVKARTWRSSSTAGRLQSGVPRPCSACARRWPGRRPGSRHAGVPAAGPAMASTTAFGPSAASRSCRLPPVSAAKSACSPEQHRAGVEPASICITVTPLSASPASCAGSARRAPARQQRGVAVDAAQARDIEYRLGAGSHATTTIGSARRAASSAWASALRRLCGCMTGRPCSGAKALHRAGHRFCPRPAGRSGWVWAATIRCGVSAGP